MIPRSFSMLLKQQKKNLKIFRDYVQSLFLLNLTAENRAALREFEGLERLVEFVGKKVSAFCFDGEGTNKIINSKC